MKSILKTSMILSLSALAAACSTESPKANDTVEQKSPSANPELVSTDDQLPEATVLRVKLDANGNPIKGTDSLRVVGQTGPDSSVINEFASGLEKMQAADLKADELDRTTSAQSWSLTNLMINQDPSQDQYQDQYPNEQNEQTIPANQGNQGQFPQYPQQPAPQQQANCGVCPQSQTPPQCQPCPEQVEHTQGPSTAEYPVSRKRVIQHRTRDVHPTQYVDVYPVETVRVHPTRTVTRVHPLQTQIQYVGNHCQQQVTACGYAANYFPTVNFNGYSQYYHYQSYQDQGGYRYFRYCRPRVFARHGWHHRW
ncbi:MAG: hypothetical protein NT027_10855 [Proteobacteria bacterium]|nr:hypothetical protein [Pseudomonadota bacterium]